MISQINLLTTHFCFSFLCRCDKGYQHDFLLKIFEPRTRDVTSLTLQFADSAEIEARDCHVFVVYCAAGLLV